MNNLALTYNKLGHHNEALELQERTLAMRKRVLPADHPDVATSMGNLAHTYGELGRHTEALELHEQTMALRKRALLIHARPCISGRDAPRRTRSCG